MRDIGTIQEAVSISRGRAGILFRYDEQRQKFREMCDAAKTVEDVKEIVETLRLSSVPSGQREADELRLRAEFATRTRRWPVTTRKYPVTVCQES